MLMTRTEKCSQACQLRMIQIDSSFSHYTRRLKATHPTSSKNLKWPTIQWSQGIVSKVHTPQKLKITNFESISILKFTFWAFNVFGIQRLRFWITMETKPTSIIKNSFCLLPFFSKRVQRLYIALLKFWFL